MHSGPESPARLSWIIGLGALLGRVVAWCIATLVFRGLRVRRAHVEGAWVRAGIRTSPFGMYLALAQSLLEFLTLTVIGALSPRLARAYLGTHVVFDEASLRKVRNAKGSILAATHTGNWDLVACAVANQLPLAVVTKRLSVRWLDRVWQSTRASMGVRLIEARPGCLAEISELLRSGYHVAVMIDQAPPPGAPAVSSIFLGQTCAHDLSPALLAKRFGVPLHVVASYRTGVRQHVSVLKCVEDVRAETPEQATVLASQALDLFVTEHPSDWLWLHRRWKSRLPETFKKG